MIKFVITILFVCFSFACSAQTDWDSLMVHLPILECPMKDTIDYIEYPSPIILDAATWAQNGLDSLELYNFAFQYELCGKMPNDYNHLLLFARNYPEESIHWLALFDLNWELMDWLQTAYDNSEGFWVVESLIQCDTVYITETTSFDIPQDSTTIHLITENGFEQIKQ